MPNRITTAVAQAGQSIGVGRNSRSRSRRQDRSLPKFLLQSPSEVRRKFYELDSLQLERLHHASVNPEDPLWRVEDTPEVRARNRYSNVSPWESNRVHLAVPESACDYINASPIVLRSRKDGSTKRYIATQGPKAAQCSHMWRMIWQETGEVAVVVMLTKTFELGRDKCFQYFPNAETEPLEVRDEDNEFGDDFVATITLVEKKRDPRSSCTVRKLELRVGDKVKTVWHLLFKGWPDYNVPEGEDKSALLELIRLANEKNSGPENPLIVHCSAGVGRSGTFITLDHFIRDIDAGAITAAEREDIVFNTVNQLREQRMYMVQSEVQFQFIYTVLKERYMRRSKSSSPALVHVHEEEDEARHSA